ncbi:diguanylate cyclase [Zavarzinia compransoris]|uniref:diguanylate cyclase domain-containing protein n=1 Tax=Zavarzinia marina TaxID=2911065 RepID=UPI001F3A565D|nr:diguanylate cyclase [Zavarzinia marina]MCF4165301.1 diguanylate cyclase [Zavarzinia marina]
MAGENPNFAFDHEALGRRLIAEVDRCSRYSRLLTLIRFDLHGGSGAVPDVAAGISADTLGDILRPSDTVAALGNHRFCILAPESSPEAGAMIARRVWHWTAERIRPPEGSTRPRLSFGVAGFEGRADSALDLYARAGMALAYAVAQGGDRVAVMRPGGVMIVDEIRRASA